MRTSPAEPGPTWSSRSPGPPPVNLFDVFWKELEVLGTRVYEPEDYEKAIGLLAGGRLPLADLITSVEPLERMPAALEELERNPSSMKILVDCRAEA